MNKSLKLAPVLIATHTRIDHLTRTVNALRQNYLAENTELFIASDAGRNEQEIKQVEVIRDFIDSITGFKRVIKIYRNRNYGHFDNFQDATDLVFKENEKIIKLEDDIVTSPFFLRYMNEGLELYDKDPRVLAITGHIWSGMQIVGDDDTTLLTAANGWGWGTWKSKFYQIDHSPELAKLFLKKWSLFWKMNLTNPSLLGMVYAASVGKLKAGDVNWALNLIYNNRYVLYPRQSLVRNIGFDGTGQNCNIDPMFIQQKINQSRAVLVTNLDSDSIKRNNKVLFYYFGGYRHLAFQLLIYFIQKYLGSSALNKLIKVKNTFTKFLR